MLSASRMASAFVNYQYQRKSDLSYSSFLSFWCPAFLSSYLTVILTSYLPVPSPLAVFLSIFAERKTYSTHDSGLLLACYLWHCDSGSSLLLACYLWLVTHDSGLLVVVGSSLLLVTVLYVVRLLLHEFCVLVHDFDNINATVSRFSNNKVLENW